MVSIQELYAEIEGKSILKGLSLDVKPGEVHAIMGPNGSGKSTLGKILAGHPDYEVTSGSVTFDGGNLLDMDADERARNGVFMAFQYPVEIPGVNNASFLRMSYNAKRKHLGLPEVDPFEFELLLQKQSKLLKLGEGLLDRSVNDGFSGGEKKRNEILQMMLLEPKLVILDETDSGLDIDALRIVAESVNRFKSPDRSFLVITHYQRLLDYIVPDVVHVLANGKIVKTGDHLLVRELEERGYDWLTGAIPSEVGG